MSTSDRRGLLLGKRLLRTLPYVSTPPWLSDTETALRGWLMLNRKTFVAHFSFHVIESEKMARNWEGRSVTLRDVFPSKRFKLTNHLGQELSEQSRSSRGASNVWPPETLRWNDELENGWTATVFLKHVRDDHITTLVYCGRHELHRTTEGRAKKGRYEPWQELLMFDDGRDLMRSKLVEAYLLQKSHHGVLIECPSSAAFSEPRHGYPVRALLETIESALYDGSPTIVRYDGMPQATKEARQAVRALLEHLKCLTQISTDDGLPVERLSKDVLVQTAKTCISKLQAVSDELGGTIPESTIEVPLSGGLPALDSTKSILTLAVPRPDDLPAQIQRLKAIFTAMTGNAEWSSNPDGPSR